MQKTVHIYTCKCKYSWTQIATDTSSWQLLDIKDTCLHHFDSCVIILTCFATKITVKQNTCMSVYGKLIGVELNLAVIFSTTEVKSVKYICVASNNRVPSNFNLPNFKRQSLFIATAK